MREMTTGRLPLSQTNFNLAASEAPAQTDISSTGECALAHTRTVITDGAGVPESASSQYLIGGSLNVALMLWGARAPSHVVNVIHVMPDSRTVVTGSANGQVVLWTADFNAKVWAITLSVCQHVTHCRRSHHDTCYSHTPSASWRLRRVACSRARHALSPPTEPGMCVA
jgi:hypothetical protein